MQRFPKTVDIVSLLFLLFFILSCGNEGQSLESKILKTWPNGSLKQEATIIDLGEDSSKVTIQQYYQNGLLEYSVEKKLIGNPPSLSNPDIVMYKDGDSTAFFPEGTKKLRIKYRGGELNGTSEYYYENGNLKELVSFLSGKKDGQHVFYFENGNPELESEYALGERRGWQREYFENGQLKTEWLEGPQKEKTEARYFTEKGERDFQREFAAKDMEEMYYEIRLQLSNNIASLFILPQWNNFLLENVESQAKGFHLSKEKQVPSRKMGFEDFIIKEFRTADQKSKISFFILDPGSNVSYQGDFFVTRIRLENVAWVFQPTVEMGSQRKELLNKSKVISPSNPYYLLDSILDQRVDFIQNRELQNFLRSRLISPIATEETLKIHGVFNQSEIQLFRDYYDSFLKSKELILYTSSRERYFFPYDNQQEFTLRFDKQDRLVLFFWQQSWLFMDGESYFNQ